MMTFLRCILLPCIASVAVGRLNTCLPRQFFRLTISQEIWLAFGTSRRGLVTLRGE